MGNGAAIDSRVRTFASALGWALSFGLALEILSGGPGNAAPGGLFTRHQLQELKSWGVTPVAPTYVPPGFRASVAMEPAEHAYDITYRGPQGAFFVWEGGPSTVEDKLAGPSHGGGSKIVSNISNAVTRFFHHSAAAPPTASGQAGLAPEAEANPNENDLAAPSLLLGPAHFHLDQHRCANGALGVSARGIGNAKYSLTGCGVSPDDLVQIYRSAAAVKT
jgi:hypothetical protein